MGNRAVILLSGGMDSATALAIAKSEGLDAIALTFDYRQRHRKEVEAARRIARHFGVRDHRVVRLDLGEIGGVPAPSPHRDRTRLRGRVPG